MEHISHFYYWLCNKKEQGGITSLSLKEDLQYDFF
jgi:hypothetical protein